MLVATTAAALALLPSANLAYSAADTNTRQEVAISQLPPAEAARANLNDVKVMLAAVKTSGGHCITKSGAFC
jgi:hypothetical protein